MYHYCDHRCYVLPFHGDEYTPANMNYAQHQQSSAHDGHGSSFEQQQRHHQQVAQQYASATTPQQIARVAAAAAVAAANSNSNINKPTIFPGSTSFNPYSQQQPNNDQRYAALYSSHQSQSSRLLPQEQTLHGLNSFHRVPPPPQPDMSLTIEHQQQINNIKTNLTMDNTRQPFDINSLKNNVANGTLFGGDLQVVTTSTNNSGSLKHVGLSSYFSGKDESNQGTIHRNISFEQPDATSNQQQLANGSSSASSSNNAAVSRTCNICGKQFGNSSGLAKHRLTHSEERKYICPLVECGKAFKRQDHLTGHMMTHQEKKPFACPVNGCDKSYCDSRSLKRHVDQHDQSQIPSDFRLMFFDDAHEVENNNIKSSSSAASAQLSSTTHSSNNGAAIAAATSVASHQNSMLLSLPAPANTKPTISMPNNNATGLAVVSGSGVCETIKPYKCQVCGRRFRKSAGLNGHMRLHGGFNATTSASGGGSVRAFSRNKPPPRRLLARRGSRSHGQSPAPPMTMLRDIGRHNSGGDVLNSSMNDEDDDDAFISNDAADSAARYLLSSAVSMRPELFAGNGLSVPSIDLPNNAGDGANFARFTANSNSNLSTALLHPHMFVSDADGLMMKKSVSAGASPLNGNQFEQKSDYSPQQQQHQEQLILLDQNAADVNGRRHISPLRFGGFATGNLTTSDLAALAQMSMAPSLLLNGAVSSTTNNYVAMPIVNFTTNNNNNNLLTYATGNSSAALSQQDLIMNAAANASNNQQYTLVDYEESISSDGQGSGGGAAGLSNNNMENALYLQQQQVDTIVQQQYVQSSSPTAVPIVVTTSSYYADNNSSVVGPVRSPNYLPQRQFSYEQSQRDAPTPYENVARPSQQQQARHQYLSVMNPRSTTTYSAVPQRQEQQVSAQREQVSHPHTLQQPFLPPFASLRSPSTSPKTPKNNAVPHFFGAPAGVGAASIGAVSKPLDHQLFHHHHHPQHEAAGIPRSSSSSQFSSLAVAARTTTVALPLSPNLLSSQPISRVAGVATGAGLHAAPDPTTTSAAALAVHASASAPDLVGMAVHSPAEPTSFNVATGQYMDKTHADGGGGDSAKDPSHVFTVPVLQPKRSRKSRPANLVLADNNAADIAGGSGAVLQPDWGHSLLRSPRPRDKPNGVAAAGGGQQQHNVQSTSGSGGVAGANYVPPYTPPPLLSPFRPGSGMFYNLFKKMKLKTHVAESVTQLAAAARGNSQLQDAGKLLFSPSIPKFLNTATNRAGGSTQEPVAPHKHISTSPPAANVSPGNRQPPASANNNVLSPLMTTAGSSQQSSPSLLPMYSGSKYLSVATPTIESRSAAAVLREQLVGDGAGRLAAASAFERGRAMADMPMLAKAAVVVESNTVLPRPTIVLEGDVDAKRSPVFIENADRTSKADNVMQNIVSDDDVSNLATNNSGSFDSSTTTTTTSGSADVLAEPLETDVMPHINIGEAYQAVIPDAIAVTFTTDADYGNMNEPQSTREYDSPDEEREVLVWHPSTAARINSISGRSGGGGAGAKVLKLYLETVSSAIVPFGASNTELALHVLHACKGNAKHALSLMLQPDKLRQFLLNRDTATGAVAVNEEQMNENLLTPSNADTELRPRRRSRRLLRNSKNDFAAKSRVNGSTTASALARVEKVCRVFNYGEHTEWNASDVRKFCEAMEQHDKDFFLIARELKTRSTSECVEFYYVWKKACPDEFRRLRTLRRKRELELYGAAAGMADALPARRSPPPPTTTTQNETLCSEISLVTCEADVAAERAMPTSLSMPATNNHTNTNFYAELPQPTSIDHHNGSLQTTNHVLPPDDTTTSSSTFYVHRSSREQNGFVDAENNNFMPQFSGREFDRTTAERTTTTTNSHRIVANESLEAVAAHNGPSSSSSTSQHQQHYYWPHQQHTYQHRHPSIMSAMHPSSFNFNTIDQDEPNHHDAHHHQMSSSSLAQRRHTQLHHHQSSSSSMNIDSFSFDFDDLEFNFDVVDTHTSATTTNTLTQQQAAVESREIDHRQQQFTAVGRNSSLIDDYSTTGGFLPTHDHHHRLDTRY